MAVLKCKMCGGTLELSNEKFVVCEKCGALVKVLIECTCENCGIKCCGEIMKEISAEEAKRRLEK